MSQPGNCCSHFSVSEERGKSGLRRAECQVTPGRREPTASAAENKPPDRRAVPLGSSVR